MPIERVLKSKGKDFKRELNNIIRRLYRVFTNHPEKFKLQKLYGLHGHIYYYTTEKRSTIDRIQLDYRREFIPTLIHECLHHFYPHAEEELVLALEKRIMKEISEKQVKGILRKFVEHVCV